MNAVTASTPLDVTQIRAEFPCLDQEVHGKPLVYLDTAATAQKPRAVLDAIRGYYEKDCANIHRGVHTLSQRATESYEGARASIQRALGAAESREIVFTRSATEAINLAAQGWARPRLQEGDEILLTHLEHHSNIVPWQLVEAQTGAKLRVVPIDDDGELEMDAFRSLLGPRTKVVAMAHVSNALGTVLPVRELAAAAREQGAVTVVDGAQAAPHLPLDVRELGVDFYAVSGHKMYGPSGTGVLYGRAELFEQMEPWQGGGDMIRTVSFEGTQWNDLPWKFEAGTPHIAGGIGLGAAAEYLDAIGRERVSAHEHQLLERALTVLDAIDGVRILGRAKDHAAVVSFVVDGLHPHDAGTILDQEGVAVRTGHHCAEPVMARYGVPATIRASFGIYNTLDEVDRLAAALEQAIEIFR